MKSKKPYRVEEEIEVKDNATGMGRDYQTRKHRSWGYLRLSTCQGGQGDVFMSDTQHQHRVRLTVGPAEMLVMEAGDRHHATTGIPFAEVEVTEADLGRLISRNAAHSGVPCTVLRVGKEVMPICPPSTRFKEFADEVKDKTDNVTAPLNELEAILHSLQVIVNKPGAIKKGEIRQVVQDALACTSACYRTVTDTLPFYVDMLVEHMSAVVEDGKASINAHAALIASEYGLEPSVLQLGEGADEG